MTLFVAALVFIFGAAIGSFLSTVIYRLRHNKKGIFFGRSVDVTSGKEQRLKWQHLIPIFSFLFLRGRSAFTGKKISVHYLLLEIVTALTFLVIFLSWNFLEPISSTIDPNFITYSINWETFGIFFYYIVIFTFLIAIFFYDLLYKEIPDSFSLPAIAIAITGGLLLGTVTPVNMFIGAIALFVFFLLQFAISKGTWIGGGDLRMGLLIGALLGWDRGLFALVIAYTIGAILSIILLIAKKVTRKTAIPFGPFLIIGATIMVFFGKEILDYYLLNFTI